MPRQSITFACKIQPVPSAEKNRYVAMASMDQLRKFLPNVDVEKNYDILPVAFQGFNVNIFNKNDDGVDSAGAVAFYKSFIGKPINLEHTRTDTIGYIISSTLTELGTNKEISEEEALKTNKPFNVVFGGVIWRLIDGDLAEKIEESQEPDSPFYGKFFASFEVGFDDFDVVGIKHGSRNLEDGGVLDKEKYAKNLRAYSGSGSQDGYTLFRLVKGELLGLGAALTTNPAAFVEPLATPLEEDDKEDDKEEDDKEKEEKEDETDAKTAETLANLELEKQKSVKIRKSMKITKIEDLNDEAMKEISASSVREFLSDKVQEFAVQYKQDSENKEKELQAKEEAHKTLLAEHEALKTQTAELRSTLEAIQAQALARENQEKLNVRMTELEATYDLSPEDTAILTKKVAGLKDDEYVAFASELEVLLKEKNKEYKKTLSAKKEPQTVATTEAAKTEAPSGDVIVASTTVDTALDNAKQVNANIPGASAPAETIADLVKRAFGGDNMKITY